MLLRKPVSPDTNFAQLESANELFRESQELSPPSKSPPADLVGSAKDGYEWVEWPPGTDNHWYRAQNSSSEWAQYGK